VPQTLPRLAPRVHFRRERPQRGVVQLAGLREPRPALHGAALGAARGVPHAGHVDPEAVLRPRNDLGGHGAAARVSLAARESATR
jgi:hypothetical protein